MHHRIGDQVPMVLQDPRDGVLYAALAHEHFGNKLHRSENGGATWQEIAVPAYPPKPHDVPAIKDPIGGIEIPWRLELIWELQPDPTDDGGLWCGTIPGGLFHSADRGENWLAGAVTLESAGAGRVDGRRIRLPRHLLGPGGSA